MQVGLWLWMAWKTGTGRGWARVLSTVFFGLLCVQFIVSLAVLASGKGTTGATAIFIVILVGWIVGLTALILLGQRKSSSFFAAAKRAKEMAAYQGVPGYQPPSYGQ